MDAPLRLHAVVLPAADFGRAEKFYRWVLAMKPHAGDVTPGSALGWERQDRIFLVDAGAPGAEEALLLDLPPKTVEDAAGWLTERSLVPERVAIPAAHEETIHDLWPDLPVELATGREVRNRLRIALRGAGLPRIDLRVPLLAEGAPADASVGSGALEVPGLLGVTTAVADGVEARAYLERLGIEPLDPEVAEGPLRVGDQQWIVEEHQAEGLTSVAVVVQAARIQDLVRTLAKLEVEFRHDGNRILARDPAGRILVVHGIKGG
jgi:hypothetical protein